MKSIWICDDDHSVRFVLEKALSREGLPVRSFSNARDVLTALEEGDSPQVLDDLATTLRRVLNVERDAAVRAATYFELRSIVHRLAQAFPDQPRYRGMLASLQAMGHPEAGQPLGDNPAD